VFGVAAATRPPRLRRVVPLLLAFGVIVGPVVRWLEKEVERGHAKVGAFGLLVACLAFIVRPLASELEEATFAIDHGPWLGGNLSRGQRFLLPYPSALYLTQGLSMSFGGAAYLVVSSPGITAIDLLAIVFVAIGGAFTGLAFGRLIAGLLIIRTAGLWAAPRWAWTAGAMIVFSCATIGSVRALLLAASYSPVF
jgi:hypothetical protein